MIGPETPTTSPEEPLEDTSVLVLAGGSGTRMADYHPDIPEKLLLPVADSEGADQPLVWRTVKSIKEGNGEDVDVRLLTSLNPNSGGRRIEDAALDALLSEGEFIDTVREPYPMGTAGAVAHAQYKRASSLGDTIIITPGDTVFPYSMLKDIVKAHHETDAAMTWAVTTARDPNQQNQGLLTINERTGELLETREHDPSQSQRRQGGTEATSAGVVVVNRERFMEFFLENFARRYPRNDYEDPHTFDLYKEVIPLAIEAGLMMGAYDVRTPVYDLGTPERFQRLAHLAAADYNPSSN